MPDHFSSPKQLISHARDEIKEADNLVTQFIRSQRYSNVVYVNPQTGEQVFRIKVAGPSLPAKVSNVAKDAAGNLRDALDHAVYGCAVALKGGTPAATGFPFAKDHTGVSGMAKSQSDEDKVLMRLLKTPPKPHKAAADDGRIQTPDSAAGKNKRQVQRTSRSGRREKT